MTRERTQAQVWGTREVPRAARSAHSPAGDARTVAENLAVQLSTAGADPGLVVVFAWPHLDGPGIATELRCLMPETRVVGCSAAGEFTESAIGHGEVSALALPRETVPRVATALVDWSTGATQDVAAAARDLEEQIGVPLRDLDPDRHVGVVLIDGLSDREEEVNAALGRVAPFLSFVGGSASDDQEFTRTWVTTDSGATEHGAVLALLELAAPFTVLKTCSFRPTRRSFTVTRAARSERTVYQLDGRPVVEVYAEATGASPDALDHTLFRRHPLGVMIDGEPWIRSPQAVLPNGGLKFYCQIPEGMTVHLMEPTDMIADTGAAMAAACARLGTPATGALMFNCLHRRLVLDETGRHREFVEAFGDVPLAGLHTYGESWLGHINQTCVGLVFG